MAKTSNTLSAPLRGLGVDSRIIYFLLFLLLLLITATIASAQRPTTPPLDLPLVSDLETSLQAFYERERDAQLTAFDTKKSGDWKDLLPSVGVGYTFDNSPRPTVSWSPISILNRKDNRRKEALTRDAMLRSYDVIISDRLFKLRQLVSDYFIDFDALKSKEAALQLDELLYDIVEESYKANRVEPKEYLLEQKKILLARATVDEYRQELHKKRSEVIYTAKWEEKM